MLSSQKHCSSEVCIACAFKSADSIKLGQFPHHQQILVGLLLMVASGHHHLIDLKYPNVQTSMQLNFY